MERRTAKRKLTGTKVFLHHPDLPSTPCTTRDLSAEGVFVETPHGHRVPVNTVLKMTFAVDLGNLTRLYDFRVAVARCSSDGLGLVIDRSLPAESRAVPRRVDDRHEARVLPLTRNTEPAEPLS